MSYDIFYDKQFVRLNKTGEIIPMVCGGSNNCFDVDGRGHSGRRSRDWQIYRNFITDDDKERPTTFSAMPEAILSLVEKDIRRYKDKVETDEWYIEQKYTKEDIEKSFGYYASLAIGGHTSTTSAGKLRTFFSGGIRHAKTIEELDALGINLEFRSWSWDGKFSNPEPDTIIRTEAEYFEALEIWKKWREETVTYRDGQPTQHKPSIYLGFSPSEKAVTAKLRDFRWRLRTKRVNEKKSVTAPFYFVLGNEFGYLVRYTRHGFKYGGVPRSGKPFRTEAQAESFRKKLVARNAYKAEAWKVKRVDEPKAFYEVADETK